MKWFKMYITQNSLVVYRGVSFAMGSTGKTEDVKDIDLVEKGEIQYFQCENCAFRKTYDYFGFEPPFFKKYRLKEESYVIEDPFLPSKMGEIIILGARCINCSKDVCKDINCSFYFNGTYCIPCAKMNSHTFPSIVKDKLDKIIS